MKFRFGGIRDSHVYGETGNWDQLGGIQCEEVGVGKTEVCLGGYMAAQLFLCMLDPNGHKE